MARLSFRQGIVRHQTDAISNPTFLQQVGSYVTLLVSPDPTIITFAHGTTNYLFTENVTVTNAWGPFTPGSDVWLYWDLNRVTGIRTFGHTTHEPVEAASAPTSPATGQMWFNTSFNIWYEWNGAAWVEVIRVFAAKYANSTALVSTSMNTPKFTGTQVGLTTPVTVGSLMYDGEGKPILNSKKQFFTTEDVFTTGVPTGASLKVNNIVLRAQAQQPIAAFNVVLYSDFNKIVPATPFTTLNRVYGITEEGANVNDVVNIVTEGIIFNELWDWPAVNGNVNDPVYIDNTGQIVLSPTGSDDLPVGAIVSPQAILFDPTLYGLSAGSGGGVSDHSALFGLNNDDHTQYHNDFRGDIRYYPRTTADATFAPITHAHAKTDITDFAHTHVKTDITDFAHTHNENDLPDFILATGDTMTGVLNLSGDPTNPLEAVTKQYVDSLVNGLLWRDPIDDPNLSGIDINDPSTIQGLGTNPDMHRIFIVGAAPIGLWNIFLPGTIVQWNGTAWESWDGANGTVQIGDRFGVGLEPMYFPPMIDITLVPHTGKIITITGNTPGSITYDVYTPIEPNATYVNNINSDHFSHTYSFTGTYGSGTYGTEYRWVEIASLTTLVAGTNIDITTGNIINVSPQGPGSGLDADLWDGQQAAIDTKLNNQTLLYKSGADIWFNGFLNTITDDTQTVSVFTDNNNVRATSGPTGAVQLHTSDFVGINHLIGNTTAVGVRFFDGGTNPNFHVDIRAADTLTGAVSLTLPTTQPTSDSVLVGDPTGQLDWKSLTCLTDSDIDTFIGVGGTQGNPCTDLGSNDVILSAANNVNITASNEVQFSSDVVKLDSAGTAPSLLFNTDTVNFVSVKAPSSIATDYTLTLPIDAGTPGQVLSTSGATGLTAWITPASGGGTSTCIVDSDSDTFVGVGGANATPCTDAGTNDIFMTALSGDVNVTAGNVSGGGTPAGVVNIHTWPDSTGSNDGGLINFEAHGSTRRTPPTIPGGIRLFSDSAYNPITIELGNSASVSEGNITGYLDFKVEDNNSPSSTPEFRFNDLDSSNYIGLRCPNTVSTDLVYHLPHIAPTNNGQVLTTEPAVGSNQYQMTFKNNPYDIQFTRLGAVNDLDIINRFVSGRALQIDGSLAPKHVGYCDVAPVGTAVFTVYTASSFSPDTLVNRGTITFASNSRRATIVSVPSFNITTDGHIIVEATTASGIEGVHITLSGMSL